jgi:hypothetical protein
MMDDPVPVPRAIFTMALTLGECEAQEAFRREYAARDGEARLRLLVPALAAAAAAASPGAAAAAARRNREEITAHARP